MTMVQNAHSSSDSWPAPVALGPVHARVVLPGSKSVTNRALVLAALADGPATIRGALMARDSVLMVTALTQLGTRIEQISQDPQTLNADLRVIPASIQQRKDASSLPTSAAINIDVGLAGTIMRFLPAAAALHAATQPPVHTRSPARRAADGATPGHAAGSKSTQITRRGGCALPGILGSAVWPHAA